MKSPKIIYKTIRLFEPMTIKIFCFKFRTGWKVSQEKLDWEKESSRFNNKITDKDERKKNIKIDWSLMAKCMYESHRNQSIAIKMARGCARAEVVDMDKSFGHYFKN